MNSEDWGMNDHPIDDLEMPFDGDGWEVESVEETAEPYDPTEAILPPHVHEDCEEMWDAYGPLTKHQAIFASQFGAYFSDAGMLMIALRCPDEYAHMLWSMVEPGLLTLNAVFQEHEAWKVWKEAHA